MTISNIRNHPYHFEQALQSSLDYKPSTSTISSSNNNFTWLVFINAKWVPFASSNQYKLEQTLGLGGTFVDIQDVLFPAVKRVRVFPKANYLSYLGVKYRLSRVMQPHYEINDRYYIIQQGEEEEQIIPEQDLYSLKKSDDPQLLPRNGFILSPLVIGGSNGSSTSESEQQQHHSQHQQQQQQQQQQQRRPITSRVS